MGGKKVEATITQNFPPWNASDPVTQLLFLNSYSKATPTLIRFFFYNSDSLFSTFF